MPWSVQYSAEGGYLHSGPEEKEEEDQACHV